jgi:hypothetical protein
LRQLIAPIAPRAAEKGGWHNWRNVVNIAQCGVLVGSLKTPQQFAVQVLLLCNPSTHVV